MRLGQYFLKNTVLETDRLILRKITANDACDMYEYACRPETSKYLLWSPHTSVSATKNVIEAMKNDYAAERFFDFAIIFKENSKMIGTVGFTSYDEKNQCAEAGYVISPDYWYKGIASEALAAILNFAFCELGINRVEARYMVENINSRRVMEKCQMTYEGCFRSKILVKGEFRDIGVCSILASEYFSVPRDNIYKKSEKSSIFSRLFPSRNKN